MKQSVLQLNQRLKMGRWYDAQRKLRTAAKKVWFKDIALTLVKQVSVIYHSKNMLQNGVARFLTDKHPLFIFQTFLNSPIRHSRGQVILSKKKEKNCLIINGPLWNFQMYSYYNNRNPRRTRWNSPTLESLCLQESELSAMRVVMFVVESCVGVKILSQCMRPWARRM